VYDIVTAQLTINGIRVLKNSPLFVFYRDKVDLDTKIITMPLWSFMALFGPYMNINAGLFTRIDISES
jgi:hypothetical protein